MQMLEVALSLIAYVLLMSMVASAIIDLLENRVRKKGRILVKIVRTACGGGHAFTAAFYQHPRIAVLYEGDAPSVGKEVEDAGTVRTFFAALIGRRKTQNQGLPSAIPNEAFARAFLETLIAAKPEEVRDLRPLFAEPKRVWAHPQELCTNSGTNTEPRIPASQLDAAYGLVRPLALEANGDTQRTLALLSDHFKNINDRASGWYKRWVSHWLFVIGLFLALASNGDSLRVVGRLHADPAMRASMVRLAEAYGSNTTAPISGMTGAQNTITRKTLLEEMGTAEAISGDWSHDPLFNPTQDPKREPATWAGLILSKIVGLVLTAVAISLGAPFWFQVLQMILKLRGGITGKGEAAQAEASPKALIREAQEELRTTALSEKASALAAGSPELARAAACASLSAAAYLSKDAFIKSLYGPCAETAPRVDFLSRRVKMQLEPGTELTVDTQAYIIRDGSRLTIVFRGTEPKVPADIITDLRFRQVPVEWAQGVPGVEIHRGFSAALEAIWSELATAWKETSQAPKEVVFCGHSLGGALAVLAAVRFLAEDPQHSEIFAGLYTIGQPRVGNAKFVAWAASLLKGRYLRSVNNRDAVPRVPPSPLGYTHFGSLHYFDADGKFLCDPTWLVRFIDTSLPEEELRTSSGPDWLRTMKEAGTDHSSDDYASLYKKAAAPSETSGQVGS